MYDGRFINRKDFKGRLYRNSQTGDFEQYCIHRFIIYPVFGMTTEHHSGFIPLNKQTFEEFRGICSECGEVIIIRAENVFENETQMEKYIDNLLKEKDK